MGIIKTIERRGKRLLIRITTAVIRTPKISRERALDPPPKRILVIRQHHQMGDMLLAVPAFRALRETFPQADITVVTGRINRSVLVNNPYVDHLLSYDVRNPFRVLRLLREMRRQRFDWAIVLHTVSFSFTSAMLGVLSGARLRIGSTSEPFGNRMSSAFYHVELPLPDPATLARMNEAEHNLFPLAALGVKTDDPAPLLVPTKAESTWADRFIDEHSTSDAPLLAVHPGAGKAENIWPPEKFAEVVNRLGASRALQVFVIEGPRDAEPVARFRNAVGVSNCVVRARAIGEIAALMKKCDFVLCNDTGVMHVSCAAGASTLAVFGPTDPVRWAPKCDNLHVVRSSDGSLAGIDVDEVSRRALDLLDSRRRINTSG
jgi:heptosyltransferase-2